MSTVSAYPYNAGRVACPECRGVAAFCLTCGFIWPETWALWERTVNALVAFAGFDPDRETERLA